MALNRYSGKDYDEVLKEALNSLSLEIDDVIVYKTNKKQGLFKDDLIELIVTPIIDILEFAKVTLTDLLSIMNVEVEFDTEIREKQIKIKMSSNDNPILIGRDGRTLDALQTVLRAIIKNNYGTSPYISLDVENYKDKQMMYLEKTAKRIAKEVQETKIPVELDNMNSYERLIVHNAVKEMEDIITESIGEDPNRHVVIKPKSC